MHYSAGNVLVVMVPIHIRISIPQYCKRYSRFHMNSVVLP